MATQGVKLIPGGIKALLTSSEVRSDMQGRGEAIRQACDAESSWGGYFTDTETDSERTATRVWSLSSNLPDQHNRHQRLIRNLDAGA